MALVEQFKDEDILRFVQAQYNSSQETTGKWYHENVLLESFPMNGRNIRFLTIQMFVVQYLCPCLFGMSPHHQI
jgi:hypothetical protein